MSTILVPSGPDVQINTDNGGGNGVTGAQQFPQISTLADGRFAVVYQSPSFGNAADNDIIAAIVNADGTLAGSSDVFNVGGQQTTPAVAARSDGGFGVVFANERHADGTVDPNGTNITYRTVSAAGGLGNGARDRGFQRRRRAGRAAGACHCDAYRTGGRSSSSNVSYVRHEQRRVSQRA